MSFENFPESKAPEPRSEPKKNNSRTILTGTLLVALLGTWGYIIWDKNQVKEEKQQLQSQITISDSSKNQLQSELNDA